MTLKLLLRGLEIRGNAMPWSEDDVQEHNKRAAKSPTLRKKWVAVANNALDEGHDDATAIKMANASVSRRKVKQTSWFGKSMKEIT